MRRKEMETRRLAGTLGAVLVALGVACGGSNGGNGADAGADSGAVTDSSTVADSSTLADSGADELSVQFHADSMGFRGYPEGPSLLVAAVTAPAGASVTLQVSCAPAAPVEVVPGQLVGSGVAEVFVRPATGHVGQLLTVTLQAQSGTTDADDSAQVEVIDWSEDDPTYANELIQEFLTYFDQHKPEMGLGPTTTWIETWLPEPGILVVAHRSYLSEGWELHLAWHVTIAPHDWAWVTARARDRLEPEIALCFPSQSGDRTVSEADLSDPRLPCAQ